MPSGFNTTLPTAEKGSITASKLEAYASPVDTLRNRGLVDARLDTAAGSGLSYSIGADGKPGPNGSVDKSVVEAQQQLIAAQQAQLNGGTTPGAAADPAAAPGALTPQEQLELMRSQHERELAEKDAQLQMAQLLAQSNSGGGGVARPTAPAVAKARKKARTRANVVDEDAVVSRLGGGGTGRRRTASFTGLDDGHAATEDANTLPAVIHESQEVVSGSLVKMRLTESAVVNGRTLPANTFIYGKCSLAGERLNISIETLKTGNRVFPVALEVYDVDGLEGLHIPGAITRDAAKQAGADGLNAADAITMSADPTLARGRRRGYRRQGPRPEENPPGQSAPESWLPGHVED
ncbi:conjugative transposon protein TraM (plasmid) [Hymenobacter sp. NBH84]|uniref:conjugative transposon protein TraM n=1 Tax=Hymenobacter sp. NBH84 TaxID=2596915 RepID=UPI001625995F|nr:conjugative transposon protein TraM [Hymenobacter sp. NBH84]QNE42165.1 conjugative transposon protein TraM [Hymenobacter sp. NBH84]